MSGPIAPVIPGPARRRGPIGERAGFLGTRRTLPLSMPAAVRDRDARYGMAAMDDRGRIADRIIVMALGWTPTPRWRPNRAMLASSSSGPWWGAGCN